MASEHADAPIGVPTAPTETGAAVPLVPMSVLSVEHTGEGVTVGVAARDFVGEFVGVRLEVAAGVDAGDAPVLTDALGEPVIVPEVLGVPVEAAVDVRVPVAAGVEVGVPVGATVELGVEDGKAYVHVIPVVTGIPW